MRILAMRGENLASLAAPFEVDLQQEPLNGAGLFAITGETGAGKSTLLDGLCLALFGQCPRLSAAGSSDSVPDVAGAELKETNPRTVLTRGAASGFAEADFVGADGEAYRARWTVRRARNKASGKLQNVERSLVRIRDNAAIESGIKLVDAAVEARLGLTYEQFKRTVLLAQGDFDAFLKANDNERAALLEKVTGTQKYRDISRQIFQRSSEAKDVVAKLVEKSEVAGLLEEDERTALQTQQAGMDEQSKSLQRDMDAIATSLQHLQKMDDTKKRLDTAQDQFVVLKARAEAAQTKRDLKAQFERIKALEPVNQRVVEARVEVAKSSSAAQNSQVLLEVVKTGLTAKQEQASQASVVFNELEAELAKFMPDWSAADQLDTKLGELETEGKRLRDRSEVTITEAKQAADTLTAHDKALDEQKALQSSVKEQMARLSATKVLKDRRDSLFADLDEFDRVQVALSQDAERLVETRKRKTELSQIQSKLSSQLEQFVSELAGCEQDLAVKKGKLVALGAEAARKDMERLSAFRQRAEKLQENSRLFLRAKRDKDAEQAAWKKLERQMASLQQTRDKSVAELKFRDVALEKARGLSTIAEAAQGDHAKSLRAELVDDEPCPVCGSDQHPIDTQEGRAALDTLFGSVFLQRKEAEEARAAAQRNLDTVNRDLATCEASLKTASVQGTKYEQEAAQLYSGIEIAWSALDAPFQIELALAAVLGEPDVLNAVLAQVDAKAGSLRDVLSSEDVLRKDLEQVDAKLRDLRDAHQKATQDQQQKTEAVSTNRVELSKVETRHTSNEDVRLRLEQRLGETLLAGGLVYGSLGGELSSLKATLQERIAIWEQLEQQEGITSAALQSLEKETGGLTEKRDALVKTSGVFQADLDALRATHQDRIAERKLLLGGVPTAEHREAFQNKHSNAKERITNATNAQNLAREEWGRLEAGLIGAKAAEEKAKVALTHCMDNLISELAILGLTLDAYQGLHERSLAEWDGLVAVLKELDDAYAAAQTAVLTWEKELTSVQALELPKEPRDTLSSQLEGLRLALSELQVSKGVSAEKLRVDEEARKKAQQIMGLLLEAKETANTWGAISEAIGSADGSKFQKVAQGVTLDLLVELANKQLQQLKPRYQLKRADSGLGLFVIDRDMGDAPRSTRSLSGGERFLISLSLALALSGLEGRQSFVDTLFIDEGFGSLDAESLDLAIDALEMLQGQGRKVGVISHVEALKDRIPVQIQVLRQGSGRSRIAINAPAGW
ncbi:AAA family ATPase [Pseudovibrio sp. Tun.PSC04-5.I4]|uniref:AAA family ATPase n=1 Tax=Pseudovibrio sp. Tun.PSC04-5.I4 TaxID=1798213 RepID=UPI000890CCA4|nr:AAA family ATPase [Pseudovibrio sp. Tun.PSC04-5.I4]SDR35339.1 exonuclease SbcC [Pseudovibrio sp. Tun.PSC04-5.I4]